MKTPKRTNPLRKTEVQTTLHLGAGIRRALEQYATDQGWTISMAGNMLLGQKLDAIRREKKESRP